MKTGRIKKTGKRAGEKRGEKKGEEKGKRHVEREKERKNTTYAQMTLYAIKCHQRIPAICLIEDQFWIIQGKSN